MTCYERIVWFFQITLAVKKNEYSTSFPRTPFEFILEKKEVSRNTYAAVHCQMVDYAIQTYRTFRRS